MWKTACVRCFPQASNIAKKYILLKILHKRKDKKVCRGVHLFEMCAVIWDQVAIFFLAFPILSAIVVQIKTNPWWFLCHIFWENLSVQNQTSVCLFECVYHLGGALVAHWVERIPSSRSGQGPSPTGARCCMSFPIYLSLSNKAQKCQKERKSWMFLSPVCQVKHSQLPISRENQSAQNRHTFPLLTQRLIALTHTCTRTLS